MRRMHLLEIHDHPRFPGFLRDLVTDALEAMWDYGNIYQPIAPRLARALSDCHTHAVVDLCSGGGGPWMRLSREIGADQDGHPLEVCLTDKYPNIEAFERASTKGENGPATGAKVGFCPRPVDAMRVPCDLRGFRTIFSSFHHFAPLEARELLRTAVSSGEGVGVFEAAKRCPRTMLLVFWVPVLALALAPTIRPFRWSRLFWTYLLPVVPFVLWFDGLVSCLRCYSASELREMISGISGLRWEIGEAKSGLLPVTYLIGSPLGGPSYQES